MSKESHVKFETAKLLKDKGFDEKTVYHYTNCDVLQHNIVYNEYKNSEMLNAYSAPTQQMACKWLMEEKHIFIGKSFTKDKETLNLEFHSPIFNMDTGELITTIGAFCPEDAIEAALEYVLTKLI